MEDSIFCRAT